MQELFLRFFFSRKKLDIVDKKHVGFPVSAPKAPTPIAMLLPQDDQVWINYVNTWIQLKQERGFFDELGKKWQLLN